MAIHESINSKLLFHYQRMDEIALKEVERLPRKILKQHKHLDYFLMAMGTYFVVDNKREIIDTWDGKGNPTYKYFKELNDFISEWDSILKLTGNPMKFTATGEIITDW